MSRRVSYFTVYDGWDVLQIGKCDLGEVTQDEVDQTLLAVCYLSNKRQTFHYSSSNTRDATYIAAGRWIVDQATQALTAAKKVSKAPTKKGKP